MTVRLAIGDWVILERSWRQDTSMNQSVFCREIRSHRSFIV